MSSEVERSSLESLSLYIILLYRTHCSFKRTVSNTSKLNVVFRNQLARANVCNLFALISTSLNNQVLCI